MPGKIGLRATYLGNKTTRVPWYNFNRNMPAVQVAGRCNRGVRTSRGATF